MSLCILYTTRFICELLVSSWVPSTFRRTFWGRFLCVSPTVCCFLCFSLPSFFTQDVTLALNQLNQPALCDVGNTQLWQAPNPWRYPTPPAHSFPPVYIEFSPTSPSIDFTARLPNAFSYAAFPYVLWSHRAFLQIFPVRNTPQVLSRHNILGIVFI